MPSIDGTAIARSRLPRLSAARFDVRRARYGSVRYFDETANPYAKRRGRPMSAPRPLLGVVMDPIETIKPKKDSTLAMMLAAQRAGFGLAYFRQQDLTVRDGAPRARGNLVTVRDDPEDWFTLGEPWNDGL